MTARSKEFTPHSFGGRERPITVLLPEPDVPPAKPFVGRDDVVAQCLAAWLGGDDGQGALHFRLVGPPGSGMNTLVYHLAQAHLNKPMWILQGHEELAPEDIACTARVTNGGQVEYVGSPLLAAMVHGGIAFVDEIGKIPARALSLLAGVLDDRLTLTSVLAGFSVRAHPDFRFCAAMNDADAATQGLPGYIDERLRPVFRLDYPPVEETVRIVAANLANLPAALLEQFRHWASSRPQLSPRQALTLMHYALRLHRLRGGRSLNTSQAAALLEDAAAAVQERRAAS
jgi:MoxR-like ATPase